MIRISEARVVVYAPPNLEPRLHCPYIKRKDMAFDLAAMTELSADMSAEFCGQWGHDTREKHVSDSVRSLFRMMYAQCGPGFRGISCKVFVSFFAQRKLVLHFGKLGCREMTSGVPDRHPPHCLLLE